MMDIPRYEDYNFPYQALPSQPGLVPITDQSNISPNADTFGQDSSSIAMETSDPASNGHAQPLACRPNHPRQDGDVFDAAPDRNSPATNSLEDATADEFGQTNNCADGTDLGAKSKEDKADTAPAWTELKTKAGKERKRLPLACIACRRKKIRCSGDKPSCRHCSRSRIPCVYKVTTRKAAPRTDYMAMLDKRLKRMEERIMKVIPKSEQEATASVTRAVVKPPLPGSQTSGKNGSKKRGAEEAFGSGPDLAAWAQMPTKSKIAGDDRPDALHVQEEEENKLLHEGSDSLPSKELQEHLAEVYFDNIYGQSYHLLHKPSYMRKLKNNTLPPVLILSVCAVAARFTSNPQLSSSTPQFLRGEEWASQARDICMRRYEWPNITILTCLLILGLHEFGTCQGGRSWALGGQAIRMAFALQLHKDPGYDQAKQDGGKTQQRPLSFIDLEIRRRIMWACFLMDRFNSSGADRPMFIREETIQVPLPIKERYFQLDMPAPTELLDGRVPCPAQPDDGQPANARENMGVAAFMIRAVAIWGQIITYLNQGGREKDPHALWEAESQYTKLLSDAEELEATLPQSLQYTPENIEIHKTENTAGQFFFMHICMQQNILFLNRAAMYSSIARTRENAPRDFYSEASRKLVAAANRISDVLKESDRLRQFVSAPFAGYSAFSSTTVHIMGIISGDPKMKATAEANLTINVKYLHKMKKYWGMFHWMVEHVRAQYKNALDAARTGHRGHDSSSMLQYGDWFNRYPHGLSDAEFMDPVTLNKKDKGADGVLEAKPELQSVEEFISTLSPSQTSDTSTRPPKRKNVSKKHSSLNGQQQQLDTMSNSDAGGQATPDQSGAGPEQQRGYSVQPTGQNTDSTGFNAVSTSHSQAQAYNTTMSPISQANGVFSHHTSIPQFFAPDLLSMNFGQQLSESLQPSFGGFTMDATSNMTAGPSMMDGVDWDSMAAGTQTTQGHDTRRGSGRVGMNGHAQGHVNGVTHFNGQEASSAWFMPFNLEPPDLSQDMGFSVGNVDPFAGMFGGGGSGLANSPTSMSGLQHGP